MDDHENTIYGNNVPEQTSALKQMEGQANIALQKNCHRVERRRGEENE